MRHVDVRIGSVEQEDEGDDSIGRRVVTGVREDGRASSDEDVEDQHAHGRDEEQSATTNLFHHRRSRERPGQVPDLEDTIDEELDGLAFNSNGFEDLAEVVRDDTVSRPLGEEGESDDNTHALEVTGGLEEGGPSNLLSDGAIKFDGGPDFLILVLNEGVLFIAIGVVVCEGAQCLGIAVLADQPTRRLGGEPDQCNLND